MCDAHLERKIDKTNYYFKTSQKMLHFVRNTNCKQPKSCGNNLFKSLQFPSMRVFRMLSFNGLSFLAVIKKMNEM